MSRYGNTTSSESCVETKKDLKRRLKQKKEMLKDFIDISFAMDMNWENRQQVIGSTYMDIYDMKKRLKENYGRSKK